MRGNGTIIACGDGPHTRMLKLAARCVLESLRGSRLGGVPEVGGAIGGFPFAKIHSRGERPARSAVCTSSPLCSLRPCRTISLNILVEQRGGGGYRLDFELNFVTTVG